MSFQNFIEAEIFLLQKTILLSRFPLQIFNFFVNRLTKQNRRAEIKKQVENQKYFEE